MNVGGDTPMWTAVLYVSRTWVSAFEFNGVRRRPIDSLEALDVATHRRVTRVVADMAELTGLPRDQVAFAMFDLPLAAVRRHLLVGEAPPRRTDELVRSLTRTVLAAG